MGRKYTEAEYLELLAANVEKVSVLYVEPRLFSTRVGEWHEDVRDALDQLEEG